VATLITISWRDIPAQVLAKRGRETSKVQLSDRFHVAIDRAAMRAGKGSSNEYIAEWARSSRPCGEDLKAEAEAAAAALEARYTDADLERLIKAKGVDEQKIAPAADPPPAPGVH
jgi:hypothetical protein